MKLKNILLKIRKYLFIILGCLFDFNMLIYKKAIYDSNDNKFYITIYKRDFFNNWYNTQNGKYEYSYYIKLYKKSKYIYYKVLQDKFKFIYKKNELEDIFNYAINSYYEQVEINNRWEEIEKARKILEKFLKTNKIIRN